MCHSVSRPRPLSFSGEKGQLYDAVVWWASLSIKDIRHSHHEMMQESIEEQEVWGL